MNRKTTALHFLLGTWEGTGKGGFPGIKDFQYFETLTFRTNGHQDLIQYEQQTWLTDKTPSHWECGFIKLANEPGRFEFFNVQSGGRFEILSGLYQVKNDVHMVHVETTFLGNDSRVRKTERMYIFEAMQLEYSMHMALKGISMQQHLHCKLRRVHY